MERLRQKCTYGQRVLSLKHVGTCQGRASVGTENSIFTSTPKDLNEHKVTRRKQDILKRHEDYFPPNHVRHSYIPLSLNSPDRNTPENANPNTLMRHDQASAQCPIVQICQTSYTHIIQTTLPNQKFIISSSSSQELTRDSDRNPRAHNPRLTPPRPCPTPLAAKTPTRLHLQPTTRLQTQTRTDTLRTLQAHARDGRNRRATIRRTHRNAHGAIR